jgi:hypothetical protein
LTSSRSIELPLEKRLTRLKEHLEKRIEKEEFAAPPLALHLTSDNFPAP